MSDLSNDVGHNGFALSDGSLCCCLDSQEDEWKELPDDQEFARLEFAPKHKHISRIEQHLRTLVAKERRHA